MKSDVNETAPDDMDRILDQLLASQPLKAAPGALETLRQRLRRDEADVESALDPLFAIDPTLRVPNLARQVRDRLARAPEASPQPRKWFSWVTPLAAACVLGLSLFSFQQQAPAPQSAEIADSHAPHLAEDAELTQIFALASNLQVSADVSGISSVEDIAHLFN
jgi:hypothetical protein